MKLLNPRLVLNSREPVRAARSGLGGIDAAFAVDLVQMLCLGVVRLHLVVGHCPGRRCTAVVDERAEVDLRPSDVRAPQVA